MKKQSLLRAKKKFIRLGGTLPQSGQVFEFTSRHAGRLAHVDNTYAGVLFSTDLYKHANLSFAIREALRISRGQVWIVARITQKGWRGRLGNALETLGRTASAFMEPLTNLLGLKNPIPMVIHLSETELVSAVKRAGGRLVFSDHMNPFSTRKKFCIGLDRLNRQEVAHNRSELKAA